MPDKSGGGKRGVLDTGGKDEKGDPVTCLTIDRRKRERKKRNFPPRSEQKQGTRWVVCSVGVAKRKNYVKREVFAGKALPKIQRKKTVRTKKKRSSRPGPCHSRPRGNYTNYKKYDWCGAGHWGTKSPTATGV